jgi:hypothetical protein
MGDFKDFVALVKNCGSSLYLFRGTLPTMHREERDSWSVSGNIQDEDKTNDSPKQLTVTIFSVIVLQPLELTIPNNIVRIKIETN